MHEPSPLETKRAASGARAQLKDGRTEPFRGKHCHHRGHAVAEIRAIVAHEREGTVEILNYKKDGASFWNQLHLSPIRDDDGRLVYYFASQFDVTDYRKIQTLEEAEHRLLFEVDHRTKNVLAIVGSIVRLSRSDNSAIYADSVQQRVQALSRTHMLLADNGWREAPLRDITAVRSGSMKTRRGRPTTCPPLLRS
jgi:PAS domain S-box-containing protein